MENKDYTIFLEWHTRKTPVFLSHSWPKLWRGRGDLARFSKCWIREKCSANLSQSHVYNKYFVDDISHLNGKCELHRMWHPRKLYCNPVGQNYNRTSWPGKYFCSVHVTSQGVIVRAVFWKRKAPASGSVGSDSGRAAGTPTVPTEAFAGWVSRLDSRRFVPRWDPMRTERSPGGWVGWRKTWILH